MNEVIYNNTQRSIAAQANAKNWTDEELSEYLQDTLGVDGPDLSTAMHNIRSLRNTLRR